MISTESFYTLREHLCLTILNRGRRFLPDDQQNTIRQKLQDICQQQWYSFIHNFPRLFTHSLFKHSFETEKYLEIIQEPKFRDAFAKFRTSSHDLNIERGRHNNQSRTEQICTKCNSGQFEDEYHFLKTCSNLEK